MKDVLSAEERAELAVLQDALPALRVRLGSRAGGAGAGVV